MSIQYSPNNIFRGGRPAIDAVMAKRKIQLVTGTSNTASTALDVTISAKDDWQLDSVGFSFNNTTARNFSASIVGGRKILSKYNDALWFGITSSTPQRIVLDEGFYNGTTLATELQAKLNANSVFVAAGVTFVVVYSSVTGLFTITPSSGTMKYYQTANMTSPRLNESIGGYLFGFTVTSAMGATVISDTAVFGLSSSIPFVSQTASVAATYLHDTVHSLSVDQGVRILSQVASTVVTYEVAYEEIV